MGTLMSRLTIDISAHYVYFVQPKDTEELVVLLPVLAPLMDLTSYSYETFLDAFSHAVCLCNSLDDDGFVGMFQVHHAFAVYQCVALTPLLEAALKAKEILVVPYCAKEGYQEGNMRGAKIPALNCQPKPPESVFNETSVESEESDANA